MVYIIAPRSSSQLCIEYILFNNSFKYVIIVMLRFLLKCLWVFFFNHWPCLILKLQETDRYTYTHYTYTYICAHVLENLEEIDEFLGGCVLP